MQAKIILGTVQFGINYGINNKDGKVNESETNKILDFAFSKGISILDTADAYGNATDIIGSYHKKNDATYKIITKFKSENQIIQLDILVKNTLKRLNINQIYGYLFHSFDDYKSNSHLINQLAKIKEAGFIKHLGVSVYTNEEFEELLDVKSLEIIQLPYNLFDNFHQRGALIQRAKAKGKIIHVRSVFLQGLFFKNLDNLPSLLQPLKKKLITIRKLATENQLNMAELALSYVYSNPNIDGILIGVDNLKQLKNNLAAIDKPISKELRNTIDTIVIKDISLLNPSNWL